MVEVIEKKQTHFRIQIYDLKEKIKSGRGKSRNISLANHENYTADDIKYFLISCFKDKNITDKYLKMKK